MAAAHLKPAHRAVCAGLVAVAMVCDVSPSSAAEIIGTPKNSPTAAVQISSCSVTIDPEDANAFPDITLTAPPAGGSPPVSAQVELALHDALGAGDDTRVLVVPIQKSQIPLPSYPVNGNYVGLGCHLRTSTFADGTVATVDYPASHGAASSSGATLGILGGLLLVGGIAAAAGHGGGSSSNAAPAPAVTPTVTPIPITPSATPSPTPSPTPAPTATPTGTPLPTATPIPTPTASPTAGALILNPQSLTFIAAGSAYAKTAQASETNYSGTFRASPAQCADSNGTSVTVASIGPASTTTGTFTVTPLGPGTCTFSITDALGDLQTLSIGVTTTGGTVTVHKPNAKPAPTPSPSPTPFSRPQRH